MQCMCVWLLVMQILARAGFSSLVSRLRLGTKARLIDTERRKKRKTENILLTPIGWALFDLVVSGSTQDEF